MSAETLAHTHRDLATGPLPGLRPLPPPAHPPGRGGQRSPVLERPRLLRRLLATHAPVVIVVAPAGYGKTQVVAEWEARDPRPFARVDLGGGETQDSVLSTVATALARLLPGPAGGCGQLGDAWARTGAVLVLDDLHRLAPPTARSVLEALVAAVPPDGALVLLSRREPELLLGRLRAEDAVLEVRTGLLALTVREAAAVLACDGIRLSSAQLDRVMALTEGWPAAVRLAARVLREAPDVDAVLDELGTHGVLAGYVREEVLAALDPPDRVFLRRTGILGELCASSCDAVAAAAGSGERLRALARADALVLPCDAAELRFRIHPLVAAALDAELRSAEADLVPELHRRAADWHGAHGALDRAAEHAAAAGDAGRVEAAVRAGALGAITAGSTGALRRQLAALPESEVARRPQLALALGGALLVDGDRDAAERWLCAATSAPSPGAELLRAAVARDGLAAMVRDAEIAYGHGAHRPDMRAAACLLLGAGRALAGDPAGVPLLAEGARTAGPRRPLLSATCQALDALVRLEAGATDRAATDAAGARALVVHRQGGAGPLAALVFAVSAATLASGGAVAPARDDVRGALRLLDAAAAPPPWLAACTLLAAARAELRLSNAPAARELLARATRTVRAWPGAGALEAWIDAGWSRADDFAAGPEASPSALTLAELRVLRQLPTHLAFREIAARLHVSPNTVKTQAHAVYRKLGASSRSEAVTRARELGLVDA